MLSEARWWMSPEKAHSLDVDPVEVDITLVIAWSWIDRLLSFAVVFFSVLYMSASFVNWDYFGSTQLLISLRTYCDRSVRPCKTALSGGSSLFPRWERDFLIPHLAPTLCTAYMVRVTWLHESIILTRDGNQIGKCTRKLYRKQL